MTAHVAARVYRGDTVEAVHYATIVVVDASGRLTHHLGSPDLVTMTRSSIKPFQLMPLVTLGGHDRFNFTGRQLAIMCGSHNGSDQHKEVVETNLEVTGHTPEHLQCGSHRPMFMEGAGTFPMHNEHLDPTRHNCSGKHSGFLALAKMLNDPPHDYLDQGSRTQTMVKQYVADFCDYPETEMAVGTDGCSAPNFSMPLVNLARAYQKLAAGKGSELIPDDVVKRIRDAMMAYPVMVSGEGRFDLALMESLPSRVVCKVGAEGIEAIGLTDPPLGIVVKVHDGSFRPLGPICVEVLKQLGIVDKIDGYPHLKEHERPVVRNARSLETGFIESAFTLTKV